MSTPPKAAQSRVCPDGGWLAACCIVALLGLGGFASQAAAAEIVVTDGPLLEGSRDVERDFVAWSGRRDLRLIDPDSLLPVGVSVFLFGREVTTCDGPRVTTAEVLVSIDAAEQAVTDLEHEQAEGLLDQAWTQIRCLSEPLESTTLSRYHLLRALVSFRRSGTEAGSTSFRQGILISPYLQWDPVYVPDDYGEFQTVVENALRAAEGIITLSPAILARSEVRLDALTLDARTQSLPLVEGIHLLQLIEDGTTYTYTFTLGRGESAELVSREDLAASLQPGSTGPLAGAYWAEQLRGLARGADADVVWVERPGERRLFDQYHPSQDRWELVDAAMVHTRIRRGRSVRGAGIAMMLAGLAATLAGTVMAVDSRQQATDLSARIDRDIGAANLAKSWNTTKATSVLQLFTDYQGLRQRHTAGWVVGSIGLGAAISGVIPFHLGSLRARGRQPATDWETTE